MKRSLLLIPLVALAFAVSAQTVRIDTVAVMLLDRMSAIIGDLNSCAFEVETSLDIPDSTFFLPIPKVGLIKEFNTHKVYMSGPDKLLVDSKGEPGHRMYIFNGRIMAYYSYTDNNYGYIPASGGIIEAIDQVNRQYGVDFPAADFFYPSLVDDLIENSSHLIFLGETTIRGASCFHIIATGKEKSIQFWISNDSRMLPVKMVITYLEQNRHPQFEATFTNWELNPDLPQHLFNFLPPPRSREITIIPKFNY